MVKRKNNCMYAMPNELTGMGTVCAVARLACNQLGKRCACYRPHTAESRKALAEAIETKNATICDEETKEK